MAFTGFFGSLYFSYGLGLAACILCYYQRALMAGLTVLFGASILRPRRRLWPFALPLAVLGAGIALYHHLLQIRVLPEPSGVCSVTSVSCARWTAIGPFDIPLLSLIAFSAIVVAVVLDYRAYIR